MSNEKKQTILVHLSEERTIVELSKLIHQYDAEIFLKKIVNGSIIEINLKSFLGLITLQLKNGDQIEAKAIGEDAEEALREIENYFSK